MSDKTAVIQQTVGRALGDRQSRIQIAMGDYDVFIEKGLSHEEALTEAAKMYQASSSKKGFNTCWDSLKFALERRADAQEDEGTDGAGTGTVEELSERQHRAAQRAG